jgi:hypothetical protein
MNSYGFNLFALALSANSLTVLEIVANPLLPALNTIGVIRPASVATATEISAFANFLIYVPCHYEFAYGISFNANALALIIKSLTEILTF